MATPRNPGVPAKALSLMGRDRGRDGDPLEHRRCSSKTPGRLWARDRGREGDALEREGVPAEAGVGSPVPETAPADTGRITLSIIGTNDLHGRIFADQFGRGGLRVLGGFVENLRAARAAAGGGLLLLDAGDTFQGGIESNLSEGRVVVDAYGALGYTALAIGNEFDFGSVNPLDPNRRRAGGGGCRAPPPQRHGPTCAARSRWLPPARVFRFSRPTSWTTPPASPSRGPTSRRPPSSRRPASAWASSA